MKFLLPLFFVVGMLFSQGPLYAASEQGGLTVSPAFQEIILEEQSETEDFFVSVTNDTAVSVTLRLSVFDFGSLDESGGVAFLGASNDLEKKYALASWMRPEKDVIILASGETKDIRITIENRDSLGPGGHYGALTFQTEEDIASGGTGSMIAVNQLFSMLVFVKKVGGEMYDLDLANQEYASMLVRFQDIIRLRFQNSGNVHLVPRGVITVTDPLGRLVAKGIVNQESAIILPETFRVYPVRLAQVATSVIPGRYTMETAYRYDGKDDFVTTSLRFYFIPPAALVLVLIPVALFGWYVVGRQRQKRRKNILSGSDTSSNKDI